jgi:hypothetical protein
LEPVGKCDTAFHDWHALLPVPASDRCQSKNSRKCNRNE